MLPSILDPALDLERHARHAILVGLILAAFLHGAAVAHALLTPIEPAPRRVPPCQADPVEFEVVLAAVAPTRPPLIPVVVPAPVRVPLPPIPVWKAKLAPAVVSPAPVAIVILEPPAQPNEPEPPPVPSAAPVRAPRPVRLTPARLGGSVQWKCPWPKEADPEMRHIVVQVQAEVRDDGAPLAIRVVTDPGYGFGLAAQQCAMKHVYVPAHDDVGEKANGTTLPFAVHFDRY